TRRMSEALAGVDVLVCASSMEPACAIEDEPEVLRTYSRQARQPFNVTGHPALAVPAGFSSDGMPLSFQIAGRNFDEAAIYRAARAYERATGWPDRHPDL
ncbi:MAG: amidase family protein, partial [Alphaproteobacteria bacterium]|nr:amidase family protein [Alphaproteobacteria bacterium]